MERHLTGYIFSEAMLLISRRLLPVFFRSFCNTSTSDVSVVIKEVKEKSRVAIINMNRSPVNSLSIPFARELCASLSNVEVNSAGVDAVVIKSSIPGQFSAGLDLNDLYGQPLEHLEQFWTSVQDLWLQLYSSKLATVAYINGHCLAAGIIIVAACDYRFAVEGCYNFGIPAARLGMVAPSWVMKMLAQIIGTRRTEYDLQTGQMFSPKRALEIGLIDELSPAETADENSLEVVKTYLSVSQTSRLIMKQQMREEFIDAFKRKRNEDLKNFVEFVSNDTVQKNIGEYLKKIKRA